VAPPVRLYDLAAHFLSGDGIRSGRRRVPAGWSSHSADCLSSTPPVWRQPMDEWDHMAWAGGRRRFRHQGTLYELAIRRGFTGRYGGATLTDEHGRKWTAPRREVLNHARFDLPGGEWLSVLIRSGVLVNEESLQIDIGGIPLTYEAPPPLALDAFASVIRRSSIQPLVMFVLGAAMPGLFFLWALSDAVRDALFAGGGFGMVVFWAIPSVVCLFFGSYVLRSGVDRIRGTSSSVYRLVAHAPASIGWAYYRLTKGGDRMRGGEYAVILHTLDGAQHEVDLPGAAVEPVMRLVTSVAPQAAIGFSDASKRAYRELRAANG
jgi:hypothetical protein